MTQLLRLSSLINLLQVARTQLKSNPHVMIRHDNQNFVVTGNFLTTEGADQPAVVFLEIVPLEYKV